MSEAFSLKFMVAGGVLKAIRDVTVASYRNSYSMIPYLVLFLLHSGFRGRRCQRLFP